MSKEIFRHILGYCVGGTVVLILVPYGLYSAARYLDYLIPGPLIASPIIRIVISIVLAVIGFLFAVSSLVIQNVKGKGGPLEIAGIEISPKTKHLVVTGPYRFTRNPMLFGAGMLYYALAVYLNSIVAIIIVTLIMIFMLIFVKMTEEPRLLKDFGSEYEEYRKRVSMFVPWPRK